MTAARRLDTLAPEHAFVVQLCKPGRRKATPLRGRAEHVVSGEATRFTSLAELAAFMQRVLAARQDSASGTPSS